MSGADEKAALVAKSLKIIKPAPDRQIECERDLAEALGAVEDAAKIDKAMVTPSKRRKLRRDLVKTLEKAIDLAVQAAAPSEDPRVKDLESYLKEIQRTDGLMKKGARKFSNKRLYAIAEAHFLLKKYGKRPRRYREGAWHELARMLFGNDQADLFDQMEDYELFFPQGYIGHHEIER